MRNKILLLVFFCMGLAIQQTWGQHLMDLKVKKLSGDSMVISELGGKKIMFLILPLLSNHPVLHQLDSFIARYGDTVQIVGILSYESGYTSAQKGSIVELYQSRPIILLDGMYTKKSAPQQSELFQWLTKKERNRHFDTDAANVGQKFFIDQTARLYAVLPTSVSLQSRVIEKVVRANSFPAPDIGGNFP